MKRISGLIPGPGRWLALALCVIGALASGRALQAAPFVQQFTPASGYPGQQVTILGADLAGARTVDFGGTLADFVVINANRLVAVIPLAGYSGPIHVTAANGEGFSGVSFVVAPRIEEFFPDRGASNSVVTIQGANFERAGLVTFNGVPARFSITAPTQIQAAVPYGATNGPVAVVTAGGTAVSGGNFRVTGPAPIVDDYAPTSGAPGSEVVIFGVNFTNITAVRFGGVASPNFAAVAPTQIRARVPANAVTGLISVTSTGGSGTNTIPFVVTRAPVVTAFDPPFGTAGMQVVILGINFEQITNVTFNNTPVSGLSVPAPGQLVVTVPANATTGPIKVQSTQGSGASATNFVITTGPIITGIEPPMGPPGSSVVISGVNFTRVAGASAVKFNGKAAPYTVTADTQIHAQVPAGATSGPITITNSAGLGARSGDFLVTGGGPFLTSLSPNAGARGEEITIEGLNFERVSAVKFNGVSAAFQSTAPTAIRAIVPPGITTGPVTVTTPLGTSTNKLLFFAPPRITSFSPVTNAIDARVTVQGTNFIGSTLFVGALPISFVLESTNQVWFYLPADAVSGYLTLTNPAGFYTTTNFLAVLPKIATFAPAFGSPGKVVTIVGSGFNGATGVTIGGVPATFAVENSLKISALVPTNAVSGVISVTTPIGISTSTNNFIVTGASDVNLAIAGQPAIVDLGGTVTYTLQVANSGEHIVAGAVVTNTLPATFTLLSNNATMGSLVVASNIVRWSIDFLTNGTFARLTLVARPTKSGAFTNSARATFLEDSLVTGVKSVTQRTDVISAAERTLRFVPFINGTDLLVSWPVSGVTFSLELTEDLTPPIFWTPVTIQARPVQGRYEALLPMGPGQQFFRLRTGQ